MKKLLIVALVVLLLLVGLAASAWWWLTTTQSGAGWALNRAARALPSLSWERIEGDLRGGLIVHGLQVDEAGVAATVGRLELAMRIHLPPSPQVDVYWVRAFDADIQLPEADPDAESEPLELSDLASPIPIRVRELLVQNLTLRPSGATAEPLHIDRITLEGRYHDVLELSSLQLTMTDLEAGLSGRWDLSTPFAGELELDARYQVQPDVEQRLQARVSGDLDALVIDLDASGPAGLQGQIGLGEILGDPVLSLDLSGLVSDWPGLDVAIEDLTVSGRGQANAWELELAGQVSGPDIPANRWRFELAGSLHSIDIRSGRVEVFDGQLDLAGSVALAEGPRAQLDVDMRGLDLTLLYPDWPQQARLNGQLNLDATPERVIVEELSVTAPPSPMRLSGQGRWVAESEELALQLNWSEFNWPPVLDDTEPLLYSESGAITMSGRVSQWQAELDAVLRLLGQPEARIEAAAHGSETDAEIRELRIDAGTAGTAQADGHVTWTPGLSGALDLRLSAFDPGQFVEAFPGQIEVDVSVAARSLDDFSIDLRNLGGTLRNQDISGSGRLETSAEATRGGALNLDFGDNRLQINSADGRIWQVQIEAEALNQIVPEAGGRLSADGQIDLDRGQLRLEAELTNSGWADISLDQARLNAALNWQEDQAGGQLQLKLEDLDLSPWERVDQLELAIAGDCRAHTARLNLSGQRGTVDLQARGALDHCALEDLSAWTGAIEQLFIGSTPAGDWELNRPLELELSAERIYASRGCLVKATERSGRLCLRTLEVADTGRVEIGIEEVPMDLLLAPLDPMFNLTTLLSGELEAAWSEAAGLEHIAGFLELGAGALRPLGEEDSLLGVESVRLDLIPETDHLRVVLDALLEGDSRLSGQAQLADLNDLSSATVDARARLNLPDIGVFNRLITELDQLGGRLSGDMQLSGALLGPSLNGQLRLDDGLIVHAPLGVRVEDIILILEGTQERASLSGQMRGGDGTLELQGDLELVDDLWQLEARIDGERFRFTDVSWLRLNASPEIHLMRTGEGLMTLNGDIRVDHLRAGLPPGTEQRINPSPDVRVRGEVAEDDETSELAQRLQGRLGLELGDDARLSAIGMQASLAGGIELLWDRQNIEPRARGVILIPEGSYRAYGQNLQIDNGEIVFTGHAIDNPSLNVDAVRDIFGDPQVERAGVRIRGNARDPRISLFTEPPTSEENALAYVVTGANFDHASGQAAINVGFYLLPRLFVSYGIGLFEAGNVLSGRFELSQRWGIRVVSGERDTGVDLSFGIDR